MRRFQLLLGLSLALGVTGAAIWFGTDRKDVYPLGGSALRAAYLPSPKGQAQISLIVQSGEADNTGTQGIPHFVEHLAWLHAFGTAEALSDRHTNAFTSHEATEYVLRVRADQIEAALATLAKVLTPLPPDSDAMRSERDIILREYDYRNLEAPLNAYIEKMNQAGYRMDMRARSVIGTPAQIATFSLHEARAWHAATHRPGNAVLLIWAPISQRMAEGMIANVFGPPGEKRGAVPLGFSPAPPETLVRKFVDARFGQPLLNMQKTVQMLPPQDYMTQAAQLSLFFDIIDSTLPGSYAKPLRFDAQIAQSYQPQLFALSGRDYELSIMAARPDAGVSLDALYAGLTAAIAGAQIPQASFDRIKARWMKRILAQDRAQTSWDLAHMGAIRRQSPQGFAAYTAAAQAITLDEMNAMARAFAGPGRVIIDMISPR